MDPSTLTTLSTFLLIPVRVLQDELAKSVTMEQGKTLSDAKGDVFRGLGGSGQALFAPLSFTLSLPALSNRVFRGLRRMKAGAQSTLRPLPCVQQQQQSMAATCFFLFML